MEKCTLQIYSGGRVQEPAVVDGITWETSRKGEPGKLSFTCVKDDNLSFSEGAEVIFRYGDTNVFHGFVFQKQRDKEQHIQVTAYDQLRYLKNKTTYVWTGIRADQVVRRIAEDFKLKVGNLPNTGFVIPRLSCPNQSLFDTILDAIDETVMNTGNLFYLYDDFGALMLKNIKDSTTNFLINKDTAENFDYITSIDNETYNRILLVTKSSNEGAGVPTVAQDTKTMGQWGVLQYYEEVQNGENASAKAKALLKLHNKVFRNLSIKDHLGDIRIRGGSGVYVDLYLGDMTVKQRMLVEKATHTFDNGHHHMDLTLQGNEEFYG